MSGRAQRIDGPGDRADGQTSDTSSGERRELSGLAFAATAAIAFGTLAISAKLAYGRGAHPIPLLATRFGITALILFAFRIAGRRSIRLPRRDLVVSLGLGFGYACESLLFFLALERAPASVVALVFYSFPLWTNLMAAAFRLERIRAPNMIALSLGSMGVALIFSIEGIPTTALLLALGSAVAVAVYLLAAQVALRTVRPAVAAVWTAVGATLTLSIAGLASGHGLPGEAIPAAGALGVATAIAFICFYEAIGRIGSSRTSVASMLEPVATVVLAFIILNEAITGRVGMGAVLIVAALPVLALARGRSAGAPEGP
jgi:drug/metabolite transporter (DMT)-like permease